MSEEPKKKRYRGEIWEGYKKYGIWINGQLAKMKDDAPEWLKETWEAEKRDHENGLKY